MDSPSCSKAHPTFCMVIYRRVLWFVKQVVPKFLWKGQTHIIKFLEVKLSPLQLEQLVEVHEKQVIKCLSRYLDGSFGGLKDKETFWKRFSGFHFENFNFECTSSSALPYKIQTKGEGMCWLIKCHNALPWHGL